jgi:NADPH-ferrihemoprotein reductase
MEEDFLAWKDKLWVALSEEMGCTAQENVKHERSFSVLEGPASADSIYRGERSENELAGLGRYDPHVARVISSRELFQAPDRNCLHLEVDLSDSGQSYQTGDHVGIWASNSDIEVDRFLRVFGLIDKRHTTIQISSIDQTHRCPLPTPTTYEAAVRYYLEICGPVSRQSLSVLADHCNEPAQRGALLDLSTDRDRFLREVSGQQMNLAQVLQSISPEGTWLVPFEILIEGVRPLQPRYYSISSSSRVSPSRLSITVGVESVELQDHCFKGVASNYLLALHRAQIAGHHKGLQLGYDFTGPRSRYNLSIPIHIRSSRFRLPADAACPVIMIGPGTGVAPFLAFVQERRAEAEAGALIGDMVLFFGCRRKSEDFLYSEFWKVSTSVVLCDS